MMKANAATDKTVIPRAGHRLNSVLASHTGRSGSSIFLMIGFSVNKAWICAAIPIKATCPKLGTPEVPMNMYNPNTAIMFKKRLVRMDCVDSERKK